MRKNLKANLARFEVLKETKAGNLIGGFSSAIESNKPLPSNRAAANVICTNNCDGGNCIAGCGKAA